MQVRFARYAHQVAESVRFYRRSCASISRSLPRSGHSGCEYLFDAGNRLDGASRFPGR